MGKYRSPGECAADRTQKSRGNRGQKARWQVTRTGVDKKRGQFKENGELAKIYCKD